MAHLDVRLLGGFEAQFETGRKIAPSTRKTEALLAYLALAPDKPRSRDHLAGLLWSDRREEQAKSSLRQSLTALRRELHEGGKAILRTEGDSISLARDAIAVDVLEFEKQSTERSSSSLSLADTLYQGPLLDGLKVRDLVFNDWLETERMRLDNLSIDVLERLLACLLKDRKDDAAITAAQRLIARDPLRESAYRTLMRLYAAQDERGLAAREYERCRETLAGELQIEPAPATSGLYEQIMAAGDTAQDEMSRPASVPLPLPSKPSIVVLPFVNLSGDPDQSYLSDGLTEDVITSMSRFQSLFVIGAGSALSLDQSSATLAEIANDLGIEYVVEGSIRRSGDCLRVTAQLVDPFTGHRLWAERYDRLFAEIFAIQDEIVANIAGALSVNIERARAELTRNRSVDTLSAYECCLRARQSMWNWTTESASEAKSLFAKATEFDPDYAPAWVGLARIYNKTAFYQPGVDPGPSLVKAREFAETAVSLDPKSGFAYSQLSWMHLCQGHLDLARKFLDLATQNDPNDSEVLLMRAYVLGYLGDSDAAIEVAEFGMRANPYNRDSYLDAKLAAIFHTGHDQENAQNVELIQNIVPDCMAWYAAIYAYAGDREAAQNMAEKFVREFGAIWQGDPNAGPAEFAHWVAHVSNPFGHEDQRQRLVEGMRLAGLPI